MAQELENIQPGDLITSNLMNRIVDKLNSLETRVGLLEAVGPEGEAVVITGLLPSGPVGLGSELRVTGRNFGLPSANVVTIDNIQVTQFKSGSRPHR